MAENGANQFNGQHSQIKKPTFSLQVYQRRIRSKRNPNLPEELLIEILKRLPVTSLLRFMCVSKSWYSLITSPCFISAHLSHQSNPTSKNCITTLYNVQSRVFLHNLDDPIDNWSEINVPFGYKMSSIVGCCDGIICLFDDWANGVGPLVLWNPSIRKAFTLPLPKPVFKAKSFLYFDGGIGYSNWPKYILGFGFDTISKDYKVVRVMHNWDVRRQITYIHADVCSLSKGDWRRVDSSIEGGKFIIERRGVCVNGVIHWICKKKLVNSVYVKTVLSFNLANEDFGQVILPNNLLSAELFSVKLVEDKLAVSCTGDGSNVWVMEEYGIAKSWRKLLDFHLGDNVGTVLGATVSEGGKTVVTTSVGNSISWDPSNQKLTNLALPVLKPDYVDTYVRSLVLLRFENQALRCKNLPLDKKTKRLTAREYRSYYVNNMTMRNLRMEDFLN